MFHYLGSATDAPLWGALVSLGVKSTFSHSWLTSPEAVGDGELLLVLSGVTVPSEGKSTLFIFLVDPFLYGKGDI